MDKLTHQIASFATTLKFDHLSEETVRVGTQHLIDALGCAIGAQDCEPADIGRRLAAGETPGKYAGRLLFEDRLLPSQSATFINSCMIRNFDFNDRYPGGHPSDCLGAHLALAGAGAGAGKISGARFLTAMVVSYEIFNRMSDSAQLSRTGWDQGFNISLATAAGIANLLGLSFEQTANAIGISASSSVPLRVTRSGELTPWKNVATPYAARNGLFAAQLAVEGMQGPLTAFEGRDGLFQKVTGPFELAPFPTEGGEFITPIVLLKYWPIETNGQPVVWAAQELRGKTPLEDIADIEAFVNKFTKYEIGSEPEKWDPQTRETADHSLPYILARTLVDGTITVDSFGANSVLDPALRPLMQKIRVTVADDIEAMMPDGMGFRLTITMKDGTAHTSEIIDPKGHPNNPMQDDDIEAKFRAMAEPVYGAARCDAALAGWWGMRDATDLRPLIALLDI
jgi:2-methylcitrate dehydratase